MPNLSLHGIVPALITPFRQDERIDFDAWQAIIEAHLSAGVHGLFVAGPQGEFFSLDDEERLVVLRFARQAVAGRVPVYGNAGCATTRASVKLAEQAEAEGVDVIALSAPLYLRPSADELTEHYLEICRAVRAPVLACEIPAAVAARIGARAPNFIGVLDSTANLETAAGCVREGLLAFSGADSAIQAALEEGCAGVVSGVANIAPRLYVDLYYAWREGRTEEAGRLQSLVSDVEAAASLHALPAAVKHSMTLQGLPAGYCRKPVGPLAQDSRRQLSDALEPLRAAGYAGRVTRATVAG